MNNGVSIAKFNDSVPNEDFFFVSDTCAIVSDGAGGCGLYSDEWSKYLVENLPKESSIETFEDFDSWIDSIWESFYQEHEARAKQGDGLLLGKFYNEGSYATVASAWLVSDKICKWCTYGDSVVFHYNKESGILCHSFTKLSDFANPPMLVSCKEPLEESGFYHGTFDVDEQSLIFIASDALSHYILMMYAIKNKYLYQADLLEEKNQKSNNSNLLCAAELLDYDFFEDVISVLQNCSNSRETFEIKMKELNALGVLDIDDYTLVFLK